MHLLSIKLNEDYRCLKEGLIIDLKPITFLVGEQGCGKSTVLTLLQENSSKIEIDLSDHVNKFGVDSYFFDSEKMNPRTADIEANYTTPGGGSKGIGPINAVMSKFMSHGETLRKFTVDRIHQAKDCVLLLDEPESALSLRNQYKLAKELNEATNRNVQVIISTHCLPLIESVEYVYSLEHLKWIKSQEFIKLNKDGNT
jgi:predicted ATPase